MSFIREVGSVLRRCQLWLAIVTIAFAGASGQAAASSMPLFDLSNLAGIDTVIVGGSVVPEHRLLPEHSPTPEEVKNPPPDPIFLVVKDIFSKQLWISVKMARDVPLQEWSKPNILYLNYGVSAQQQVLNGKTIKVGALALQLVKYDARGPKSAIPVLPATYPFLIPDTEQEFQHTLAEGIRYLTSYLAGYLALANNKPGPPADPTNVYLNHPFREKIPAPCPPPAKGQTIPIPCGPPEE